MIKKLSGLYAITNETLMPENKFLTYALAAIESGITILQYRDKSTNQKKRIYQARELKKMCDAHNVILIINDDTHLAKQVNADGVHIGKSDSTLAETRNILGSNKIIGVSCYNQLHLAREAINSNASYIAFGRFFNSSTKPDAPLATIDLITSLKKESDMPICCIGGITTENCQPLINTGTNMLAVINDIFSHDDIDLIKQKCKQFSDMLHCPSNKPSK
ncbi:Thiamin-phosphate pyrophosphorylase [hydrothermal vent metagenome]|uniref:thiamine phosphate synthase n=1 Tax=hydrothermal vent metagenome TaxID=652676 RepID=A0A3B0WXF1_9ZZZZ